MKKPFVPSTGVGLLLIVTFDSFFNINIYGQDVQGAGNLNPASG